MNLLSHQRSGIIKSLQVICMCFCYTCLCVSPLRAQVEQEVLATSYLLNPAHQGHLTLEIDNLNFFQNDELKGDMAKGYTLPGLWIQPRLAYQPLSNLKLEVGAHLLYYHGASRYPVLNYQGIPDWQDGKGYSRGLHAMPLFRAQVSGFNNALQLILGHLYGGSTHQLIEPLYNPELNLSADPENGVQVLLNTSYVDADLWLNWQNFIFENDNHREKFQLGLSSRVKFMASQPRPWQVYLPVQFLAQHIGGEIQDEEHHGISSVANAAIGVGMSYALSHPVLQKVWGEAHFLYYKQLSGQLMPVESGHGWHVTAVMKMRDFYVKAGYMRASQFITLSGSPYFGSLSSDGISAFYPDPQLGYIKMQYAHRFGKAFSLGIYISLFQHFPGHGRLLQQGADEAFVSSDASLSVLAGIYLRIRPSLLLHVFR